MMAEQDKSLPWKEKNKILLIILVLKMKKPDFGLKVLILNFLAFLKFSKFCLVINKRVLPALVIPTWVQSLLADLGQAALHLAMLSGMDNKSRMVFSFSYLRRILENVRNAKNVRINSFNTVWFLLIIGKKWRVAILLFIDIFSLSSDRLMFWDWNKSKMATMVQLKGFRCSHYGCTVQKC